MLLKSVKSSENKSIQCDFAIPPQQEVKSVSALIHLESGLDHVIFFGQ